jgi:hypothetical protein
LALCHQLMNGFFVISNPFIPFKKYTIGIAITARIYQYQFWFKNFRPAGVNAG